MKRGPARERRSLASRIPEVRAFRAPLLALAAARRSVPLLYLELVGLEGLSPSKRRAALAASKREVAAALRAATGSVLRRADAIAAGPQARWFVALLVGRAVAAPARAGVSDADLGAVAGRLQAAVRTRLRNAPSASGAREIGVIAGWTVLDPVSPARPLAELRQAIRGAAVVARVEAQRAFVLAAVTHELRTPLMSIIGYAERLREDPEAERAVRARYASIVALEAQRLHRLVESLIDAGAWTAGRLALSCRSAPLAPIVRSAWNAVAHAAAVKSVQLAIRGDARAPVDAERMEQVFINLLDNAVRHSPACGRVHARIAEDGRHIAIVIRDEGGGFSARAARAFGTSFAPDAHGRTGLGLSIARLLVEAHGGELALGRGGGGARVEVHLPREGKPE